MCAQCHVFTLKIFLENISYPVKDNLNWCIIYNCLQKKLEKLPKSRKSCNDKQNINIIYIEKLVSRNHAFAVWKQTQKKRKTLRDKTPKRTHVNLRRKKSCYFKFFIIVVIFLHSESLAGQIFQHLVPKPGINQYGSGRKRN